LTARAAALGVALVFLSALPIAPRAQAAEPAESGGLGLKGIGARLGLVDPEGASSTIAYGVHVDAGEFIPHLHLTPLFEYWSASVGSTDRSDLTIGTNVDWDFPLAGAAFTPYAGAGLGFHHIKDTVPGSDYSISKLGLNVQGGVRDRIVPNLSLFGEVRFTFVDRTDKFKLMGGFTYNFIY
jgi:hypothetical protein